MKLKLSSLALVIFLISCASQDNLEPKISSIKNFSASGRVAINYPKCPQYQQCSQESLNASMHWKYLDNKDEISLFDPTGQERAKIIRQGEKIIYQDKKNTEELTAEELSKRLGFALPIEDLRALFLGEKRENLKDWQISLKDWQKEGYYRKLSLKKDKYQIKLLIQQLAVN